MPNQMFEIITPRASVSADVSFRSKFARAGASFWVSFNAAGVIADYREPDIVRVAPAPLYNSFMDVFQFGKIMESHASGK